MPGSDAIAVIPARLGSTRLPAKVLADIAGEPLIAHVVRRVLLAHRIGRVIVATDAAAIVAAARAAGAEAVMTSPDHPSGSDRVAEVAERLALDADQVLVNVQGDEPLVDPAHVDALVLRLDVQRMDDPDVSVATLAAPLVGDPNAPDRVKLVFDARGRALYFSRAAIPSGGPHWLHVGVYAFRVAALRRFAAMAPGSLERSERLEQLRFLEAGVSIAVVQVAHAARSVDTAADLAHVRGVFETSVSPLRPLQTG